MGDPSRGPQLAAVGLTVCFGQVAAVGPVDVTLRAGVTALLGRNGAGKTSLVRALCGAIRPTSGQVLLDGASIHASVATLRSFHSRLGYVPQAPGYPPGMPVGRYLEYVAWLRCVPRATRAGAARAAARQTQVESLLGRRLGSLSGGERRRVILAGALIGDPDILILDEPTEGLDPAQRGDYLALVTAASATRVTLLATHVIDDVLASATDVLLLDAGTVRCHEPLDELAPPASDRSGRLHELVSATTDRNA